jgi:hypothetical protein
VIGVVLVLVIDAVFFRVIAPWEALTERVPYRSRPHHQVAFARGELAALAASPEKPSAVVIGTSRADVGFVPSEARKSLPEVAWAQMAYAALRPFEIRSLVGDAIDAGADAVVIVVSEYDIGRPLRLDPIPGTAVDDVGALFELMRLGGWRFAWENRALLYEIPLSRLVGAYRFREILRNAGLDRFRTFPMESDHLAEPAPPAQPPPALTGERRFIDREKFEATARLFKPPYKGISKWQMGMLTEVGPGPHMAVQEELLRSAGRRLHAAGVKVIIVEAPLHPAAADFYDTDLRRVFLDVVADLQRECDATFVPLTAEPPFVREEFADMLHLNRKGAQRFTGVIVEAVRKTLGIGAPQGPAAPSSR